MMQFIVLGLVPGTHLEITFGWLTGCLWALIFVTLITLDIRWLLHSFSGWQAPNFARKVASLLKGNLAQQ